MQLPSLFREILYFTGRSYVIVWSESEIEVVETSVMVGRLASYNLLQGDKPPRRIMLNEVSPHLHMREISYDPSPVRVDDRSIYMWPIYPQPRPQPNDAERLNELRHCHWSVCPARSSESDYQFESAWAPDLALHGWVVHQTRSNCSANEPRSQTSTHTVSRVPDQTDLTFEALTTWPSCDLIKWRLVKVHLH